MDGYSPQHCQFGNKLFCLRLHYGAGCDRNIDKVKFLVYIFLPLSFPGDNHK